MLPRAPIRDDGWFQPPRAADAIPAPYSPLTPPGAAEKSRGVVRAILAHEWPASADGEELREARASVASGLWAPGMRFYAPSGVGFAANLAEYEEHVLGAVRRGLRRRSFALDVLTCEGGYCGAHGYLHATHTGCFLGEAATGRDVRLRLGMHWHVVDGVATEGYAMFDAPDLFAQLGIDLLARKEAPPPCAPPPLTTTATTAAHGGASRLLQAEGFAGLLVQLTWMAAQALVALTLARLLVRAVTTVSRRRDAAEPVEVEGRYVAM